LGTNGSGVTSFPFCDSNSNNETLSLCDSESSSTIGEENCNNNVLPQDDINLPNMGMEVGCVVIGKNAGADTTSYVNYYKSSDDDGGQTSDVNIYDDESSDDDSIADAVINLSSAESQFHLAMADDDDDNHSLNSYICFPDPQWTVPKPTPTKTKKTKKTRKQSTKEKKDRQTMWSSLKDYRLFMCGTLEMEIQNGLVCRLCIKDFL